MKHLADEYVTVVESPDPEHVWCYSPGLLRLESGRIIATMDFGGAGVKDMDGACRRYPRSDLYSTGRVFLSDDGGETWRQTAAALPMLCMRPFAAGDAVYVIGFCQDLGIARSDDGGETWSEMRLLSHGQYWLQGPCNVWYENGCVYLVMERLTKREGWPVCASAPVLMRGRVEDDLTDLSSWTFASELVFEEQIDQDRFVDFGIPFYPDVKDGYMAGIRCGWLETNVVRLKKKNDMFYDPSGRTFHLFMRAWTGLTWTGAIAKVVEKEDGSMETLLETAPSGRRMVFVNIPGGGQSKFHILYDERSKTYWLISNQFIDGMVNFNLMTPNERKGYDRSRLALYYSYNCFDWIFAGIVAAGNSLKESRSYASMQFDGEDLIVLSRTGDNDTLNGHDTNRITFHRIRDFRSLIDDPGYCFDME